MRDVHSFVCTSFCMLENENHTQAQYWAFFNKCFISHHVTITATMLVAKTIAVAQWQQLKGKFLLLILLLFVYDAFWPLEPSLRLQRSQFCATMWCRLPTLHPMYSPFVLPAPLPSHLTTKMLAGAHGWGPKQRWWLNLGLNSHTLHRSWVGFGQWW